MSEELTLDDLECELNRLADRMEPQGVDLRRTRLRVAWQRRLGWLGLIAVSLVVVGCLLSGYWQVAVVLGVLWLPDRVRVVLPASRQAMDAPLAGEDFLEQQLGWLQTRVARERFTLLSSLVGGAVLAGLAMLGAKDAGLLCWISIAVVLHGVVRFAFVGPRLARELSDLGGRLPGGWTIAVITIVLAVSAPFLILGGMIYRALRRLFGYEVSK